MTFLTFQRIGASLRIDEIVISGSKQNQFSRAFYTFSDLHLIINN